MILIRVHSRKSAANSSANSLQRFFRLEYASQTVEVRQVLKHLRILPAAFVLLGAAVFGVAQQPGGGKQNIRPADSTLMPTLPSAKPNEVTASSAKFVYEFKQPEFYVRRITIEHDAGGHGQITFERMRQDTPIVEPLEFSSTTQARVAGLWQALGFLDSSENYQSEREFPHLGTMWLSMNKDGRKRTVEFNWTKHPDALALVTEYRRIADQAILVFDISVARETQPLNGPKLMEELEIQLKRNGLTDPRQLLPLLKDITSDEHLPLMARNHAARLIKKIEK